MICASSIGEEQAACFEKVYYSVRFISKETQQKEKRAQLKKDSSHISVLKKRCQITLISNHAISVVGSWIFDSNYEKALVLNRASLDMICASSIGEEQAACFEKVYYSVRFIPKEAQLKKNEHN